MKKKKKQPKFLPPVEGMEINKFFKRKCGVMRHKNDKRRNLRDFYAYEGWCDD